MNTHIHESKVEHMSLEFGVILSKAWNRFTKVFLPMIALAGVTLLGIVTTALFVGAIIFGLVMFGTDHYTVALSPVTIWAVRILILSGIAALTYVLLTVSVMNIKIIQKPSFDFLELFKNSLPEVPRVFTVSFVSQFAVLGGIILGILPGLWLSIIFMFVFTIAVLEKMGVSAALSKSAYLVKGNFWNVFAFVLFMVLASIVFNLIPVIGFPLGLAISLFSSVIVYELYLTLEHNKKTVPGHVYKEKNILLLTKLFALCAALSILALLALLIVLVSSGLTMTN